METTGAYIVSWDFSNGPEKGVMIVGKKENSKMSILNAFQGKEARVIYEKLSVKNKEA